MSTLTYIAQAAVRDGRNSIEGKILTRPALLYTDGAGNVTYACDVDIGQEGEINENGDIGILPLKNVPIAANNRELIYAEVGQAVTLAKSTAGRWEIVGLAKSAPGTFIIVPVSLPSYCYGYPVVGGDPLPETEIIVGTPEEITLVVRPLNYDELDVYGDYGTITYGAIGVFNGGTLTEIRSP